MSYLSQIQEEARANGVASFIAEPTIPAGGVNVRPAQPEPSPRTSYIEGRGLVWSSLWKESDGTA